MTLQRRKLFTYHVVNMKLVPKFMRTCPARVAFTYHLVNVKQIKLTTISFHGAVIYISHS